ncbi:hypothetical protein PSTT_07893 [Puccinia striiformis]|uniref:Uncharacterized protein n=1 Tax=Puccinia striiformis TaxID=27350 RepID=A0A2S4VEM5_9BASI|nr:hypothetical protein PSTT_07893 [Puccinia striiformis]
MGLGKTLTSLALILTSKNAAESFANSKERNARRLYHGEERKKWTTQHLWANDIVLVTYDTVANLYESRCDALFEPTWFRTILDEAHNQAKQGHSSFADRTKIMLDGNPVAESAE